MISLNPKVSNLAQDMTHQGIKAKFSAIQEACFDLFSDYEVSIDIQEKKTILRDLLKHRKNFDYLVNLLPDEDVFMLEITAMRLSFEKVNKEVQYFGIEEVLESREDLLKSTKQESNENDNYLAGRNTHISEFAFQDYREEMKKYEENRGAYMSLSEDEKQKKINLMLEKLKLTSNFSLGEVREDYNLNKEPTKNRRYSDIDDLLKVEKEKRRINEELKKEKNPKKIKQLKENKQDVDKLAQMMVGLRTIHEVLFTSKNPIVGFFQNLFGKKTKKVERASAVRVVRKKLGEEYYEGWKLV